MKKVLFTALMFAGFQMAQAQTDQPSAFERSQAAAKAHVQKENAAKGRKLTDEERQKLREKAQFMKAKQDYELSKDVAKPSKDEVVKAKKKHKKHPRHKKHKTHNHGKKVSKVASKNK